MAKLYNREQIVGYQGIKRQVDLVLKGNTRHTCADETVCYCDCDGGYMNLQNEKNNWGKFERSVDYININILVILQNGGIM